MPRVSLCIIARNEESNLAECLASAADLVSETIVVDTGSTDRTREIALAHGARVCDFPWVDSFSAARNESIRHATGDWIFWLDADDRIDAENRERLGRVFAGLQDELAVYLMKCIATTSTGPATVGEHPRLFPNHPDIRWCYRVHEQIVPSVVRLGGTLRFTDVTIVHGGYLNAEQVRRKDERNLRLLRMQQAEAPDDRWTLYYLGQSLLALGRPAEAAPVFARCLELSLATDRQLPSLCSMLSRSWSLLNRTDLAIEACQTGLRFFPQDLELLFFIAYLQRQSGDLAGAESHLIRLLQTPDDPHHFPATDPRQRRYLAASTLAAIYRDQGRLAESEAVCRQLIAERPELSEAWMGLTELLLSQGRTAELDQQLATLSAQSQSVVQVSAVQAHCLRLQGRYAEARQTLEAAISQAPQSVFLRMALTHVLLQEGRDWLAAEQALRDVLALEPAHVQAQHNLAVLQQMRGAQP